MSFIRVDTIRVMIFSCNMIIPTLKSQVLFLFIASYIIHFFLEQLQACLLLKHSNYIELIFYHETQHVGKTLKIDSISNHTNLFSIE